MQLPARDERAEAAALNAPDPGTIPGGVGLAIRAANEPRWRCTPAALPAGALQRLLPGLTQGVWPLRRLLDMPPDMPQTLGGRASAGLGAEAARGPAVGQKLAWQACCWVQKRPAHARGPRLAEGGSAERAAAARRGGQGRAKPRRRPLACPEAPGSLQPTPCQ